MQTEVFRLVYLIKEVKINRVPDIGAEFLPGIGLGNDVLPKRFCDEYSIRILYDFKDKFFHGKILQPALEGFLNNVTQRFRAVLEKVGGGLGWTTVRVPFEPREVWGEVVRLRVRGEVNGFGFRTSLFPDPRGGLCLLVNRVVQRGAEIGLGDEAEFRLWPDLEERQAELPDELAVLLDEEEGLRGWYDELSEAMRREIGKWVLGVKSEEARARRVMQMAERLLAAMDAERELPPLIATALRRRPRALAGWEKMTRTQRRQHLLGVFYYQTPESRKKRVGKLVEEAERRATAAVRNADFLQE